MKPILLLFMMAGCCAAGDPKKDFHGSPSSWGASKTFLVGYKNAEQAKKDCERLKFAIEEDYQKGSFFICTLNPNVSFAKLLELTACDSVEHVSPNPKFKAVP